MLYEFDKQIIEKRKELSEHKPKSELQVDLEDEVYNELCTIANEIGVSVEDLLVNCIHSFVLKNLDTPKDIEDVIDTAIFEIKIDEILDSNKNFMLVDTCDFNKKSILITNKEMIAAMESIKLN